MITDWDDAYANREHIPDGIGYIARWEASSETFRAQMHEAGRAELDVTYGPAPRNKLDLFRPEGAEHGLVVFIHGGYWRLFDKSYWSHLARGCVEKGWAVAIPGYTLAPEISIAGITREITAAVEIAAGLVSGPVRLTGHSAGGHLACRMICTDTKLPADLLDRIVHTVSISGVHDLRPILNLAHNSDLRLDLASARAESPALLEPLANQRITAWVGGDERPEFIRQARLVANVWAGFSVDIACEVIPDQNHFSVIDPLEYAASPLVRAILG